MNLKILFLSTLLVTNLSYAEYQEAPVHYIPTSNTDDIQYVLDDEQTYLVSAMEDIPETTIAGYEGAGLN